MRMRDLRVGMEVAEEPHSWDTNGRPERFVVMDLGNYTMDRWPVQETTLTATTASGEVVEARSRFLVPKSKSARRTHVIVAKSRPTYRTDDSDFQWVLDEMPLWRIEGPYSKVKEVRAQQRGEAKARSERNKARKDEVANRVNKAVDRLEALGYGSRVNIHSPGRNEVVLKIKVVEAMLDHLEGRDPS